MVANDVGDDVAANRALIEEALRKYNNGTMSMYELIGSKYNEDLSVPFEGNYITRGYAEKEYEDAAFSLEVGEISDVVESYGVTASGQKVSCFYLIKRLELDPQYVSDNFPELEEVYRDGVMAERLEEVKKSLRFEPNEYCASLTLSSLEAPKSLSSAVIIIAAVVAVAVVAVIAFVALKKRRTKAVLNR